MCPDIQRCEIIVVDGDNGSSLIPETILPIQIVRCEPGRAAQLNRGAALARAAGLLFLHVDTFLPRRFVTHVRQALAATPAGAFDLTIESRHPIVRMISVFGRIRSRIRRRPYGDQAHFMRRELFEALGGYPEMPLMEDVAMMDLIRQSGTPITVLPHAARTSDRRWQAEGVLYGTLRNWRLMIAYRAGVRTEQLRKRYKPQSELESDRARHVVFYRALRENGVKTRLASALGAETAAAIYRACVRDLHHETRQTGIQTDWFVDDPSAGAQLHLFDVPQHGSTLFTRMSDAFLREFAAGVGRVILTGSDIPGLRAEIIRSAMASLKSVDAVLGPSRNGGYYLIGFRAASFAPELVDIGTAADSDDPLEITTRRIQDAGLRLAFVPALVDIDTAADLSDVIADDRVAARRVRRAVARRRLDLSVY
jgi:rSAM/selenodomain-associated transferase 2